MTPHPSTAPDAPLGGADPARELRASRPAMTPARPGLTSARPGEESQIQLHCERANFAAATRLILHRYGAEVRAFLTNRTRNRMSMEEVFSTFSEDVWKGLPGFRFQGKVRSWIYAVARNALSRHIRTKQRWGKRHVVAELDELHVEVRRSMDTRLGDYSRLEPVLAELKPEDRRLLEQRLVLSMQWKDIAAERAHPGRAPTESELSRESARLRKRYQTLVSRLRDQLVTSRASQIV